MNIDWSIGVDMLTPTEIRAHQQIAWDPEKAGDDELMQLVCEKIQSWRLPRYRKYLKKVEKAQGNIVDGFPLD
jgi:hypothetical protein